MAVSTASLNPIATAPSALLPSAHPRTRIMRTDARASRPCEYGATGTGKNQGMWGGFRAGPAFQNLRPLERSIPLRPSQHGLSGSTTT